MTITVSDHAVLRYLQRVMDVDVEGLRRDLAQMLGARVPAGLHDCVLTIDGLSFTIRNGCLVTLFERDQRKVRSELDDAR